MDTYNYMTPAYKAYTVKCPKCKRRAITSRVESTKRTVYIHVQEQNTTTGIWTLIDSCIVGDEPKEPTP